MEVKYTLNKQFEWFEPLKINCDCLIIIEIWRLVSFNMVNEKHMSNFSALSLPFIQNQNKKTFLLFLIFVLLGKKYW